MSDARPSAKYLVPAHVHRTEATIKRSRFITTVARANTPAAAQEAVDRVRAEFPDATHHCWAYVAGPPGSTRAIGMSDDGEPHGTAGKPMLNVLLHADVGEVVAVCTRYYGGVKLGTGGLSRAYAGGVTNTLQSLRTELEQEYVALVLEVPYEHSEAIRRLTSQVGAVIDSAHYGRVVAFSVLTPSERREDFVAGVREITRGTITPTERRGH